MSNISKQVDIIEKGIQESFGVETERLSPFSFKFMSDIKKKYKTDKESLHKSIEDIISKSGLFTQDEIRNSSSGLANKIYHTSTYLDVVTNNDALSQKQLIQYISNSLFQGFSNVYREKLKEKFTPITNVKRITIRGFSDLFWYLAIVFTICFSL